MHVACATLYAETNAPSIFMVDPTVRHGPWKETDFWPRFRKLLRDGCWYADAAPEMARRTVATETFIFIHNICIVVAFML